MKLRLIAAAVAALALTGTAAAQNTSTEQGKLSYALGYDLGRNAIESGEQVDVNTIIKGLQDGYGKKQPSVPVDQLRTAVQNMQQRQQTKAKAAWDKAAAENKTKSDQFIAANKSKAGVKSLPSGVQYREIEKGSGAKPTQASTVQLEVAGPYAWGERPQQARPAQQIPSIKVSDIEMPAMREALLQMPAGSKWEITLPSDKAYGADPRTPFPPNVAVQFEVKLVSVK
ncbi:MULTISPECIES: FKBP-type peptidyl-prolyl cis-trans isomerase N-terminal domain-containing protein [Lysobacter]|uniref:Peptidyl-prolyl cis-trans isomerase n=1 Tax=Lysobacter soli TaxID=453783 RepID=A0A3D8VJN1_9GAMM|nr:FKBP-type peptidyl-prolyl cis-trans isomerase N-terminal domain-containing protein [Lysobacter soli]MDG2516413.1 FKBP-type peptidyl-prolyl cis-trans isomerase N-terminal domain-containing protein [Lysobacter soli]QGW64580.1 FKBP-type peptidyl-prolyl cis-trans isomerase [Lysobacter soli]RDY69576.1 FKBP-type peptidyl-prolyl cis-trans isomerase [Lysobacter soli]UTA53673.1 FKBP-type peptidyl-prolyl cis-trans isomerase [Lysobacter soli]